MVWLSVILLLLIQRVSGNDDKLLADLCHKYYMWRLEDSPESASILGVHDADDQIDKMGIAGFEETKNKVDEFLLLLLKIDYSALPRKSQYNYEVLNDTLTTVSDGYAWRMYDALNPISFLGGPQSDPETLLKISRFETKQDFENFISRLEAFPRQLEEIEELMQHAITLGRTNNKHVMAKVPGQFANIIKKNPKHFIYYKPFVKDLEQLNIETAEKKDIRERGMNASIVLNRAFERLKHFVLKDYMPHARNKFGVGSFYEGAAYYATCLKWHLKIDMTPTTVHNIGLSEVARISKKMIKVMHKHKFNGTIYQYFLLLREDPHLHYESAEKLIAKYKDILYDRLYPSLHKAFNRIPKVKLKISKMAEDGPPAQYMPGSIDGLRPAEFQINVFRPKETDKFVMAGDAMHEAVPGHHFQFTTKQMLDLPEFRKEDTAGPSYSVPFSYPGYTSYVEGWAMYAEYLGEELGLYVNDYELMGRYSNEIFRAARLVVDTGIHHMGWSRNKALHYMKRYIALNGGNLENEIDRYSMWPGQACAYKIGELKILELRHKAEIALGMQFSLKDFHDVVLGCGAVPLSLLERIVNDWINDILSEDHHAQNSHVHVRLETEEEHEEHENQKLHELKDSLADTLEGIKYK